MKTFRTGANLPRNGLPSKFTARSDHPVLRVPAKSLKATARTLQALVSMFNVKLHDTTIGKVARRKPFLYKAAFE